MGRGKPPSHARIWGYMKMKLRLRVRPGSENSYAHMSVTNTITIRPTTTISDSMADRITSCVRYLFGLHPVRPTMASALASI